MLLSRVCRRLVPRGTCGMSSSPTSRGTVSPWASLPPLEQIMSPSTPSSIDEAAADCETIDLWLDEHDVAHVQLARPDKLNAVDLTNEQKAFVLAALATTAKNIDSLITGIYKGAN